MPTGLGALIVKNSSLNYLKKSYFGGGTVEMHLVNKSGHVGKTAEDQFEDGTLHFQGRWKIYIYALVLKIPIFAMKKFLFLGLKL